MFSKTLAIAFAGGLAVVALCVVFVFQGQKGAHLELVGKILKVRSIALDDGASIVAVDFRVTNPSDYKFMNHEATLTVVDAGGHETTGDTISEVDSKRIFEGMPLLGPKYNPGLAINDVVMPHTTVDRMLAARFEVPESAIQTRKNMILRVAEINGTANVELKER